MAGIRDYIHGEKGIVESLSIEQDDEGRLYRVLRMSGNPFRFDVIDYGSDIRIDPTLKKGESACYVRVDSWCGFWARSEEHYQPQINHAINRYFSPEDIDRNKFEIKNLNRHSLPEPIEASIFLSHSSWNKLFARFLRKDLERFGRVTVWLDEEQNDSLNTQNKLESWLSTAINKAKGIVILWHDACLTSEWVQREFEWAIERSSIVPIVVVNCDGTQIPDSLIECAHVVSVEGLWYAHGLGEEIFSYLHGFEPRSSWVIKNEILGNPGMKDPVSECMTYEDIAPHEGTAVTDLKWRIYNDNLIWSFKLRDRITGNIHEIKGPQTANDQNRKVRTAADFGIKKGNRVARLASYRTSAYGWSSTYYSLVWMRIDEPYLSLEWVDSCHFIQLSIAKELKNYKPDLVNLSKAVIPHWFDPEEIAKRYDFMDAAVITDTAEMLLLNGIQLRQVQLNPNFIFNPEELNWLQLDVLASNLHDLGVTSMLQHGYKWCPYGYKHEGYNSNLAPFESMTNDYKESIRKDITLGIRTIMESGIVLIPPQDVRKSNS